MQENDIIEPSTSPWNSPIILVPKKLGSDGQRSWRPVIDYRRINDQIEHDAYQLPLIEEILGSLGGNLYFSTLDWASGFHQIGLKKSCRKYTAFSSPCGKFQMKRMAMGLKNSPAAFQRIADHVLAGLTPKNCLLYLDDIIIYGRTIHEHNNNLRRVLGSLRRFRIKLSIKKCQFLKQELIFLKHKIDKNGIYPDPSKFQVILDYKRPESSQDIKRFLGLINYYGNFIQNCGLIKIPLQKLLKNNCEFVWGHEQEEAFQKLKGLLIKSPCLAHPNLNETFIVTTDGSEIGLGAILSQSINGLERPIEFRSRATTDSEKKRHKFKSHEFECLAVKFALEKFRHYLIGKPFILYTDNKVITYLKQKQSFKSQYMTRWAIELQDFDFVAKHRKGETIPHTDALSRAFNLHNDPENNITMTRFKPAYILSTEQRNKIFENAHNIPLMGHRSIKDTIQNIKDLGYEWLNLADDIREKVRKCGKCQLNKTHYGKMPKSPMALTDIPNQPMDKIAIDIVGHLPKSHNNFMYILTVKCLLTKFVFAIPLENTEAETVARALITEVFLNFSFPKVRLSDQGTNFLSKLFKAFCKMLNVKKIQTTAFRPQSNGSLERYHRSLNDYLRIYCNDANWDQYLKFATFSYNYSKHNATKYSPFELMFGRRPNLPHSIKTPPQKVFTSEDDYLSELKQNLRYAHEQAKNNLQSSQMRNKNMLDKSIGC